MNENEELELQNEELNEEELEEWLIDDWWDDWNWPITLTEEEINSMLDESYKPELEVWLMLNKCLWQYWAYVNYQRAIPDLTDWLKPAQRRIIYAMRELWMTPNWKHLKSARLEWEVIWKYHPHWWCYSTFAWMAQDFTYRYPLVDWQGNFWSIAWDSPAAQRYTEVRPSKLFSLLVDNLWKLDDNMFHDNYDGTLKEPNVLPAKIPFIFLNGTTWIWLWISSQTMPFNLWEVVDTLIWRIQDKNFDISTTLKWPDFCQKWTVIMTDQQWKNILETWKWSVTFLSNIEINRTDRKNWNSEIIVKSLWPNIWTDKLIDILRKLVESKKIVEIQDVRDESTSNTELDVKIILKQKVNEDVVLNKLLRLTPLQTSVNTRMIVLNNWHTPKLRSFYEIFDEFIEWRKVIVKQILNYDLRQDLNEKRNLEAKIAAIKNLDAVIKIIQTTEDDEEILDKLMKLMNIDKEQADLIYNLKLKQLKSINQKELETNLENIIKEIEEITETLNKEEKLIQYMIKEWTEIKEKYWDKRRSEIKLWNSKLSEVDEDQYYDDNDISIYLTNEWYIKKIDDMKISTQKRWWKWRKWEIKTISDDIIIKTLQTTNKKTIWLITENWRIYYLKWYKLPMNQKWMPLSSIIWKEVKEKIINMFVLNELLNNKVLIVYWNWNWMIVDWNNLEKRSWSQLFKWEVKFIETIHWKDECNLMIWNSNWLCNKIKMEKIRELSNVWKWIRLMKMKEWDKVISAEVVQSWNSLLVVTEQWFWKIINVDDVRETNRWSKWVKIWIREWDQLSYIWKIDFENLKNYIIVLITKNNKIISIKGTEFYKEQRRNTKWLKLVNLEEWDIISNVELIENE